MRIIGEVSQEEMNEKFPDVMAGLSADDADYCGHDAANGGCDGLRVMVTGEDGIRRCAACGTPRPKFPA
jgi:hypothetical protein